MYEQGKPQMIGVTCSPHSSGPRYQDTQRRGVRCLAAIHAKGGHIKFLSGGYDGAVYEWVAGVENLDEPRSRKVVSHDACIMALAYRDRDRSIVVSAQKKLHVTDLNRCKTMIHPFSNDVQQIHIHPQAAYVTLLEVSVIWFLAVVLSRVARSGTWTTKFSYMTAAKQTLTVSHA